jgi:hypothetical protein
VHVTSEAAPEPSAFATVTIEPAKKRSLLSAVLAAAAAALIVIVLVIAGRGGNGGGAAGGGGDGGTGDNGGVAATVDSRFASIRVHAGPAGGSDNVVGQVHDGEAIYRDLPNAEQGVRQDR